MREITTKFLDYLRTTDKFILRIIFLHLIVENEINEILSIVSKNPKRLTKSSFATKVNILEVFGICDQTLINNIREINNLRNLVAHNLWIPSSEVEGIISKIKTSTRMNLENINDCIETILIECCEELVSINEDLNRTS